MRRALPVLVFTIISIPVFADAPPLPVARKTFEPLETGRFLFLEIADPYDVYVDGEYRGTTPLLLTGLSTESETLIIESGNETLVRKLSVSEDIDSVTHFVPEPHPYTGAVALSSDPPGAEVYFGELMLGKTPLTVSDVIEGDYGITLRYLGRMPTRATVSVARSDISNVQITLSKAAMLRFSPEPPPGSAVMVYDEDGTFVASAEPGETVPVPAGYCRVEVSGVLFRTWTVELRDSGEEIIIPFEPDYYRPRLVFENLRGESLVLLNGEDVTAELVDGVLTVSPGAYSVTVSTEKKQDYTRNLVLTGDQQEILEPAYARDPALVAKGRKNTVFSAAIGGSLITVGGIVLNLDMVAVPLSSSYQDYRTLKYASLGTVGEGLLMLIVGGIISLSG